MPSLPQPGPDLVLAVRACFVRRGSSLGRWCRDHGVTIQNARLALLGGWNGPKGRSMRAKIIKASGLAESTERAA